MWSPNFIEEKTEKQNDYTQLDQDEYDDIETTIDNDSKIIN